ncbi:Monoacylglycerol lipase abhd12 [Modicella reniformis]|uniref:Monoacylglycerol lipase abhd12 n=1 Tax=Modicella reniformis TaxID=1440133 RepID=A0A9P6SP50_9FUNG|nr:Monoacylglycerol lipase abhd12 [Modicella reniformis]
MAFTFVSMIINLLVTALMLCILGAVFLLVVYLSGYSWQKCALSNASHLLASATAFSTRNIWITTSDGLRLGAWHILPKSTSRDTLERIHANELLTPISQKANDPTTVGPDRIVNEGTEAIFEDALKIAEKVVLYFHGQVGDRGKSNRITTYKGVQNAIPSAHVITIDCRGYGDSEGFPSEVGFKIDAFAAWQWVTQRVPSEKIIIYGHSLGSGIAANLCLQLEEHQLAPLAMVLDAAFTSMPDMMTAYRKIPIIRPFARFPFLLHHFKLRLLDRFETVRAVETIKSPLLLIHGQEDADVLISNSHTLFHTALTARRLQSGEVAFAEEELARAGFDLPFERSHTTGRDLGSLNHQSLQRSLKGHRQQDEHALDGNLEKSIYANDSQSLSADGHSGIVNRAVYDSNNELAAIPSHGGSKEEHDFNDIKLTGHPEQEQRQFHTVQLSFPREGTFEFNQEYQIGFLTVQYAVHNTCMEFAISKEVLGSFVKTVENRRRVEGTLQGVEDKQGDQALDLVRVLSHEKIGYVDRSEVPEVVE